MYARFKLQNFIYSMRSAFKLIDKMDLYDMINYDYKLIEALEWLLHDSQIMNAEKGDFDKKLMEVARGCFHVIKKVIPYVMGTRLGAEGGWEGGEVGCRKGEEEEDGEKREKQGKGTN
ncbi:heat shock 70 kDa protein BIP2-like [Malus sylvestris]|uniref:heat shock 70 kDa protein BIP2-like n=1 Tax=Malus sylvestris TaxID=3752 RepID=UPI0021ABF22F|nr:heat shock 70 kDa protein BIP2-like [Malus sylvestris]